MKARIINIEEVPYQAISHGDRYECKVAWVGAKTGAKKLGYNITVLPPGKRPFPYHAHRGHEEMFFILEGRGTIRIDGESHPVREGDFVSLPPGRESAHQMINDSSAPLRYLAVSTMEIPEVVEYPESGKLGVFAGEPPGRSVSKDSIRHFTMVEDGVEYWEGEK